MPRVPAHLKVQLGTGEVPTHTDRTDRLRESYLSFLSQLYPDVVRSFVNEETAALFEAVVLATPAGPSFAVVPGMKEPGPDAFDRAVMLGDPMALTLMDRLTATASEWGLGSCAWFRQSIIGTLDRWTPGFDERPTLHATTDAYLTWLDRQSTAQEFTLPVRYVPATERRKEVEQRVLADLRLQLDRIEAEATASLRWSREKMSESAPQYLSSSENVSDIAARHLWWLVTYQFEPALPFQGLARMDAKGRRKPSNTVSGQTRKEQLDTTEIKKSISDLATLLGIALRAPRPGRPPQSRHGRS